MAVRIVKHTLELIAILTDQNPVQVLVDAALAESNSIQETLQQHQIGRGSSSYLTSLDNHERELLGSGGWIGSLHLN